MPNGGSDCCGTCPFNGVNLGRVGYPETETENFNCEIRKFRISNAFYTYCDNHPRRNPLWDRTPRGPVWSAVVHTLNTKPLCAPSTLK